MVRVMAPMKDISGDKFGRLTALARTNIKTVHGMKWLCVCECGAFRTAVLAHLKSGHTKSCGCLVREVALKPKNMTHGHTTNDLKATSSEYHIWSTMKQRCTNPNNVSYPRYGGRGIRVDESWLGPSGYSQFFEDMGARPSKAHSLDRINPNGPYSKDNCRWATSEQQNSNRAGVRQITYQGRTLTSAGWERVTGIAAVTIRSRIDKGWTTEAALTTPVANTGRRG